MTITHQTSPAPRPPARPAGGQVPAEVVPPAPSAGTTPHDVPFDHNAWLRDAKAACGCCSALIENEEDLRRVRERHPDFFEPEPEPAPQNGWEEIDRVIEEGRRLGMDERLGGMFHEQW